MICIEISPKCVFSSAVLVWKCIQLKVLSREFRMAWAQTGWNGFFATVPSLAGPTTRASNFSMVGEVLGHIDLL